MNEVTQERPPSPEKMAQTLQNWGIEFAVKGGLKLAGTLAVIPPIMNDAVARGGSAGATEALAAVAGTVAMTMWGGADLLNARRVFVGFDDLIRNGKKGETYGKIQEALKRKKTMVTNTKNEIVSNLKLTWTPLPKK